MYLLFFLENIFRLQGRSRLRAGRMYILAKKERGLHEITRVVAPVGKSSSLRGPRVVFAVEPVAGVLCLLGITVLCIYASWASVS